MRRIALAIALLFFGTDIAARLWLSSNPEQQVIDFIRTRPAPYRDAPYWSDDFIAEQVKARLNWHGVMEGWIEADDWQGVYYSYSNGIRDTSYQPAQWQHTIWIFGNSTLAANEVPNDYTIPSYLQAMLNEAKPNTYRVLNYGLPGIDVAPRVHLLQTLEVKENDIVIFLDGGMEALGMYNSCYFGRSCFPGALSGVMDVLCRFYRYSPPQEVLNNNQLQAYTDNAAERYHNALVDAYRFTTERGAAFLNIIQPHLWTKPLSVYEQSLNANKYIIHPQLEKAFTMLWPKLQRVAADVPTIDMTHSLDKLRETQDIFLDCCHVTEQGNQVVALAIAESLPQR